MTKAIATDSDRQLTSPFLKLRAPKSLSEADLPTKNDSTPYLTRRVGLEPEL
jgi:hypothetical protein